MNHSEAILISPHLSKNNILGHCLQSCARRLKPSSAIICVSGCLSLITHTRIDITEVTIWRTQKQMRQVVQVILKKTREIARYALKVWLRSLTQVKVNFHLNIPSAASEQRFAYLCHNLHPWWNCSPVVKGRICSLCQTGIQTFAVLVPWTYRKHQAELVPRVLKIGSTAKWKESIDNALK